MKLQKNDVIQTTEKCREDWRGCLLQVDEVKSWGVQAWVKIPGSGNAYVRLNNDEFEVVGHAVMTPADDEEEE